MVVVAIYSKTSNILVNFAFIIIIIIIVYYYYY